MIFTLWRLENERSSLHARSGGVLGQEPSRLIFWPHVGRVDNVFGDRNPVCSCVGMENYQS